MKIYQIDAFTKEAFKGNPAGVMFIDKNTETEFLQNIATEMNLSETAFIIPEGDIWPIRYFTPLKEVSLCGHATLASAHLIYELGLLPENETIKLQAKGGELQINKEGDWLSMVFPKYTLKEIEVIDGIEKAIGFTPIEMYKSDYDWIIAVASTESEILNANPQISAIEELGAPHLMVTAKSENEAIDFVLRVFAPGAGIPEDPVTGSAHCALTPLWADKLNKNELRSFQLSKRTGKLTTRIQGNKVIIKGQAITVFEANLKI